MRLMPSARIEFASDSSILVDFGGVPSLEASAVVHHLRERLEKASPQWTYLNLHPAYTSLLIDFDPFRVSPLGFLEHIRTLLRAPFVSESSSARDPIVIPVHYGGSDGPDLADVAARAGLTEDDVVRLHAGADYTVAFLGFAPGFPYLHGLPGRLASPRKAAPRIRVPAGSVALAGTQTGIYPAESPGGWQLIGRTNVELYSPGRTENPTLLTPGDHVRFVPVASFPDTKRSPAAEREPSSGSAVVEIESIGIFSSVQGLGRDGWTHLGISPGGAADPVALRAGNGIVANVPHASAIEMTMEGGVFRFLKDTWFAVCGPSVDVRLDGQPVSLWSSLPACAGQRLEIGRLRAGFRSYLCVHGGIGNASPLRTGLRLMSADESAGDPSFQKVADPIYGMYASLRRVLRVTRGPQWDWFPKESQSALFTREFEVSTESNRLGSRLIGPSLELLPEKRGVEMVSEGIANGAIQVASGGQPMMLFCEQRTTGGYPKIANVIRADWYLMGQLAPGTLLRFEDVGLEEAWKFNAELENVAFVKGLRIDLNLDAGESETLLQDGSETALYALVTSVNIACGGHAGNETTMSRALELAAARGLCIGAHPSFPDKAGFGRVRIEMPRAALVDSLTTQIEALATLCRRSGLRLTHVKPHGALYNECAQDRELALAVLEAVRRVDASLAVVALAGSPFLEWARQEGLSARAEAFTDRRYEADGRLRSRRHPDASIDDPSEAARQAVRIVTEGKVVSVAGSLVTVAADTLCVHGDGPHAFAIASAVRAALESVGVEIRALGHP